LPSRTGRHRLSPEEKKKKYICKREQHLRGFILKEITKEWRVTAS